jgi:hypothetical protein
LVAPRPRVAVAGASGFVGTHLLPALAARCDVVALGRSPRPPSAHIEWRGCDLFSASSTRAALEGVDVAIYLVHSMMPSSRLFQGSFHDTDLLLRVDPDLFGEPAPLASTFELIEAYLPYVEARLAEGFRLADMTRHMLGLFGGMPGARAWRRHLSTEGVKRGAGVEVLRDGARLVRPTVEAA